MANSGKNNNNNNKRRSLYPRAWGAGNVAYVGTFRAFSMAVLGRSSLEIGDKIILPQQALQSINRLRLPFPLIFEIRKFQNSKSNHNHCLTQNQVLNQYKRRIENIYRSTNPTKLNKIDKWLKKYKNNPHDLYIKICKNYGILPKSKLISSSSSSMNRMKINNNNNDNKRKSFGKQYCSVYEFSSPQSDSAYLPHWMMQNLAIDEGEKIELQSQFNIPKGNYCKLQPFKQEFMDRVSTIGYKSTLEHSLRHYSVLSINQRIVVEFNHFPYQCIIKELKPANAISILGSTDLEIEFHLPPLEQLSHYNQQIKTEQEQQKEQEQEEEQEEESSSSISSLEFEQQEQDKRIVNKCDIDGQLLKKLGVPLDYNQQTNLATMIIENRKLQQENQLRFDNKQRNSQNQIANLAAIDVTDDDDDDDNDTDSSSSQQEEEKKEEEKEEENGINFGPDNVKCNNCDKYIHKMSIQMHEVHCIRENIKCEICKKCIKIQDKNDHFENYHKEIICICNEICIGKIFYDKHRSKKCKLRLVSCKYCDKTNIAISEIKKHQKICGETLKICKICNKSYLLKNKKNHDCGIICVLCGLRINDSKNKLLHLLTDCPQRRAICNYCGILRKCNDMEQHRKYCGSRSEKCQKCLQFVSLMNMEPHLQSNCQWFNNNQLSSKNINKKLQSLHLNKNNDDDNNDNNNENNNNDNSLFGLLKSNHEPNLVSIGYHDDDDQNQNKNINQSNRQLCPHCISDDTLMDQEEFQIHIASKHPHLVDATLTQTIMASFNNPDIINNNNNNNNNIKNKKLKKKKKRRKLSSDIIETNRKTNNYKTTSKNIKTRQRSKSDHMMQNNDNNKYWNCQLCTFVNTNTKRRCIMCQTPKTN